MEIRTNAPAVNNKYYVKTTYGGYNKAILINKDTGSVLPNCVGYAYGRFMECANVTSCNLPTTNANTWYNANHGYAKGFEVKQGGVMCFDGKLGHVAIVEEVYSNGSVLVSQSNYGGTRFETKVLQYPYSHNGLTYQGTIYNPYIETEDTKIKMRGCDVSQWQVPNSVTIQDKDFVIIRATYGRIIDTNANEWRLLCEQLNIPYGVYCYSYAESEQEATNEAIFIADVIKDWNVQMGVWYDMEIDNFKREHGITTPTQWTNFCNAFCKKAQELGYYTGIYASESYFNSHIHTTDWDRWVASWGTNDGTIQRDTQNLGTMLQYTSNGGLDKDVSYCELAHYRSYPISQNEPVLEPIDNGMNNEPSDTVNEPTTSQNEPIEAPQMPNDNYLFKMSDKTYDFLNWLVHITPLFITLYIALSNIWKWEYTEPIVATISAIMVFISSIVKQSTIGYKSGGNE